MGATADMARSRPGTVAAIGTVIGYAVVIGTFLEIVTIYPSIDLRTSTALSHAVAVVNVATIGCLVAGWYWIRTGAVRRHRAAMLSAFGLILLFLVLYLTRVGGGGTKHFVGPETATAVYLVALGIHIVLSIVAVPLVLYVLVLGLTHTPVELHGTRHAALGRLAAGTWILSLVLGLLAYVMLEHLYAWEWVVAIVPRIA